MEEECPQAEADGGAREHPWLHGEIYFQETRHSSKYLIVPDSVSDAREVLAVMCTLWELSAPEVLLALDGGQDTAQCMLENVLEPRVWDRGERRSAIANFRHGLVRASEGVATACSRSRAWVYGFDGSCGSPDGDQVWGTCLNAAWSSFGQGRRNVAAGVEFICATSLAGLFGETKFRQHAVALSSDVETVVQYPPFSHRVQKEGKTIPDCASSGGGEFNGAVRSKLLCPEFTHIILYDGGSKGRKLPDLYGALARVIPSARVVLGGVHPTLTDRVADESTSTPAIVLKHTGGAADVIAAAIEQRQAKVRKGVTLAYKQSADATLAQREEWEALCWSRRPAAQAWSLPLSANPHQFFFTVDATKDSSAEVADALQYLAPHARGCETERAGVGRFEQDQLEAAWESALTYKYNASSVGLSTGLYSYMVMVLPWLTVAATVQRIFSSKAPSEEWGLLFSGLEFDIRMIGPPLLLALVLSIASRAFPRCLPRHEQAPLANAASAVKAEIYRFRARVGEYREMSDNAFDVEACLQSMPGVHHELQSRAREPPAGAPGTDRAPRRLGGHRSFRDRLALFAMRLQLVDRELQVQGVSLARLTQPSKAAIQNERLQLVGASSAPSCQDAEEAAPRGGEAADDGVSPIGAEEYIAFRVRPAIASLQALSQSHSRAIFRLDAVRYSAALACVVFVAVELYMLVPVSVVCIGVATNILDFHQYSARLQSVGAARRSLHLLVIWWESLGKEGSQMQDVLNYIVDTAELAADADLLGSSYIAMMPPHYHGAAAGDDAACT